MTFERLETERLLLRRPSARDIESIFSRYASDPDVTRYLAWPRHRALDDTRFFLELSDVAWQRWLSGPYLIELKASGVVIGGTGLNFEALRDASTGYVLAKDAWGCGYATEALRRIVALAGELSLRRLYALVHVDHAASVRVLEKCGFVKEGERASFDFPNLDAREPHFALTYTGSLA